MGELLTSKKWENLEEKHTTLCNQIQCWHQAQLTYTPSIASFVVQSLAALPNVAKSLPVEPAETMPLHLPSFLP